MSYINRRGLMGYHYYDGLSSETDEDFVKRWRRGKRPVFVTSDESSTDDEEYVVPLYVAPPVEDFESEFDKEEWDRTRKKLKAYHLESSSDEGEVPETPEHVWNTGIGAQYSWYASGEHNTPPSTPSNRTHTLGDPETPEHVWNTEDRTRYHWYTTSLPGNYVMNEIGSTSVAPPDVSTPAAPAPHDDYESDSDRIVTPDDYEGDSERTLTPDNSESSVASDSEENVTSISSKPSSKS
ncbi:uncharacterized protein [Spinacia oleracea]|uniref:Uncharacterized protein n=1 Tax=Spinacia oleracea TaxID=3562 RepID=A0ABM3R986_SPIOL|nr:uncharacterized protein LOC130467628 [Spinacia oleracea]